MIELRQIVNDKNKMADEEVHSFCSFLVGSITVAILTTSSFTPRTELPHVHPGAEDHLSLYLRIHLDNVGGLGEE